MHRTCAVRSFVNGEPRQDSNTSDLIFDVPYIVWHLSQHLALEPGDVIMTGTPQGVALSGRFPYLAAGDVVELDIEGLGCPEAGVRLMGVFDGLTAVVTGGASGIGEAIVTRLREDGARVAVFDRQLHDRLIDAYQVDVTDDESVRAGIEKAAADLGGIDIVVNNAGIGAQGSVEANDDDEWHRVYDVNVVGAVRVTRAALPHLRRSNAAAIVNTCSIAATAGLPERALYGATKGAIQSLTLHMAADHLREGIRVNCVNPGTADTPWVGRLLDSAPDPAAERAALGARQPHGRLVQPEEVADAVAYLASPRASSTTGVSLAVDGGMQGLRLRSE